MVSIQVLATPIIGRARSSSVKPMPLSMARAPARSRPSVIMRLCCLGLGLGVMGSRFLSKDGRAFFAEGNGGLTSVSSTKAAHDGLDLVLEGALQFDF